MERGNDMTNEDVRPDIVSLDGITSIVKILLHKVATTMHMYPPQAFDNGYRPKISPEGANPSNSAHIGESALNVACAIHLDSNPYFNVEVEKPVHFWNASTCTRQKGYVDIVVSHPDTASELPIELKCQLCAHLNSFANFKARNDDNLFKKEFRSNVSEYRMCGPYVYAFNLVAARYTKNGVARALDFWRTVQKWQRPSFTGKPISADEPRKTVGDFVQDAGAKQLSNYAGGLMPRSSDTQRGVTLTLVGTKLLVAQIWRYDRVRGSRHAVTSTLEKTITCMFEQERVYPCQVEVHEDDDGDDDDDDDTEDNDVDHVIQLVKDINLVLR